MRPLGWQSQAPEHVRSNLDQAPEHIGGKGERKVKIRKDPSEGDRGKVPDLSMSGDNFDLVGDDPHDLTTTSETRSANAIAEPTPNCY
jgi:hypothetical protein